MTICNTTLTMTTTDGPLKNVSSRSWQKKWNKSSTNERKVRNGSRLTIHLNMYLYQLRQKKTEVFRLTGFLCFIMFYVWNNWYFVLNVGRNVNYPERYLKIFRTFQMKRHFYIWKKKRRFWWNFRIFNIFC